MVVENRFSVDLTTKHPRRLEDDLLLYLYKYSGTGSIVATKKSFDMFKDFFKQYASNNNVIEISRNFCGGFKYISFNPVPNYHFNMLENLSNNNFDLENEVISRIYSFCSALVKSLISCDLMGRYQIASESFL